MKHELKNKKIPYILLALLVAVVFWLFVDEFGDNGQPRSVLSQITDIPITYVGEDDLADRGLMLVDEGTSATVDLTLEGPRRTIVRPGREDVRITADLSDVTGAGVQTNDKEKDWKAAVR